MVYYLHESVNNSKKREQVKNRKGLGRERRRKNLGNRIPASAGQMKTKMMEQLEMGVKFNIGIRKIIVDFKIGFIFIK